MGSSCQTLSDIPPSHRPKTCVYVPIIKAGTLKVVFNRYAQGGSLGLYLSAGKPQSTLAFADWDKHNAFDPQNKMQLDLYVSSFSEHRMYDPESHSVS